MRNWRRKLIVCCRSFINSIIMAQARHQNSMIPFKQYWEELVLECTKARMNILVTCDV